MKKSTKQIIVSASWIGLVGGGGAVAAVAHIPIFCGIIAGMGAYSMAGYAGGIKWFDKEDSTAKERQPLLINDSHSGKSSDQSIHNNGDAEHTEEQQIFPVYGTFRTR